MASVTPRQQVAPKEAWQPDNVWKRAVNAIEVAMEVNKTAGHTAGHLTTTLELDDAASASVYIFYILRLYELYSCILARARELL